MAPPGGSCQPELSLPWLWVIEYLASSEPVNLQLLHGIIESAPLSHSDLGENVRELVALACLEQLCGPVKENETTPGRPSNLESGSVFELSRSCEDVLEDLLEEGSVSDLEMNIGEPLKSKVRRFIMQKRASMPKPALHQLKDAILGGTHPDVASLKVLSGLQCLSHSHNRVDNVDHSGICLREPVGRGDSDTNMGPNGNSNSAERDCLEQQLERDLSTRIASPSRRNLTILDTENLAQNSCVNPCSDDYFAVCSPAVKRFKQSIPDAIQSERSGATAIIESDSERDNEVEENKFDVARDHMHISDEDRVAEEVSEKLPELRVTSAGLPDGSDHLGAVQKSTSRSDPSTPVKPTDGLSGDELQHREIIVEDDVGQQHMEEPSSDSDGYQNEDNVVSLSKNEFLVSQCTSMGESLEDFDSVCQNVCMMCNEGGQLLVCHTRTCPLVVHENCVDSSTSFDENGNFFCPFCQYSTAISEYLEAKNEATDVRKDAAAFYSIIVEHQPGNLDGIVHDLSRGDINEVTEVSEGRYCSAEEGEYQEHGGQDAPVNKVNDHQRQSDKGAKRWAEAGENGNLGNEVSDHRSQGDEGSEDQAESSERKLDLNASSPIEAEEEVSSEDGTAEESPETSERNSDMNAGLPIEEEVSNKDAGREFEWVTSARRTLDTEEKQIHAEIRECQSKDRLELEGEVMAEVEHNDCNVAANNTGTLDGGSNVVGDQQEVLPDDNNEPLHNPGLALHIDGDDSMEDDIEDTDRDDEAMISSYRISIRRRTTRRVSTSPAVTPRRQKNARWTDEEVNMLKEGVAKFRNAEDKTISWKKILEFGASVFMPDRTARDLKNKWTNISKSSLKVK